MNIFRSILYSMSEIFTWIFQSFTLIGPIELEIGGLFVLFVSVI
jgi:hypothetical protein